MNGDEIRLPRYLYLCLSSMEVRQLYFLGRDQMTCRRALSDRGGKEGGPFNCRRLLAKARAMKFAFPEDGAIVERIEEGLKEEGPFDAEPISLSLACDLLALAREEARS